MGIQMQQLSPARINQVANKPLIEKLTLEEFYKAINEKLKGSFLKNDQVDINFEIKLPDENRKVELFIVGATIIRKDGDIKATFCIDLEVRTDTDDKVQSC